MGPFLRSALNCLLSYTPERTLYGTQLSLSSQRRFALGFILRFILGANIMDGSETKRGVDALTKSTFTLTMSLACKLCAKDPSLVELLLEEFGGYIDHRQDRPVEDRKFDERSVSLALAASPHLSSICVVVTAEQFSSMVLQCVDAARHCLEICGR